MATIRTTPNGYGFGNDWWLVYNDMQAESGKGELWLGQDLKVMHRMLGCTPQELAKYVKGLLDIEDFDFDNEDVRECIAGLILDVIECEDESELANLAPWALHVGGG